MQFCFDLMLLVLQSEAFSALDLMLLILRYSTACQLNMHLSAGLVSWQRRIQNVVST